MQKNVEKLLKRCKKCDKILKKDSQIVCLFFDCNLTGPIFFDESLEEDKRRETKMTKSNKNELVSLKDAAYYLVQLYFQVQTTNSNSNKWTTTKNNVVKSYRCTRTKVEKLLAIADLIGIKLQKNALFSDEIIINSCGVGFLRISDMLVGEIIPGTEDEENTLNGVLKTEFKSSQPYPPRYKPSSKFTPFAKRIIKDVFFRFGNYSAHYLGEALFDKFKNELKSDNPINDTDKYAIDSTKAYDFFTNSKNDSTENELINYIFNYSIEEFIDCEK